MLKRCVRGCIIAFLIILIFVNLKDKGKQRKTLKLKFKLECKRKSKPNLDDRNIVFVMYLF